MRQLKNIYKEIIYSNEKEFYLEIKRYVGHLTSKRKFKKLLNKINEQYKKDSKEHNKISNKLKKALLEIKKNIENKNISDNKAKELLKEFDQYISGKITSSAPLVENLIYNLSEVAWIIKDEKYEKELEIFLKEYLKVKKKFEDKKKVSIWAGFFELNLVKEALEDDFSKLNFLDKIGMSLLNREIRETIDGRSPLDIKKKEEYLRYIRKIHNFLLEKLERKFKINWRLIGWIIMFLVAIAGIILLIV